MKLNKLSIAALIVAFATAIPAVQARPDGKDGSDPKKPLPPVVQPPTDPTGTPPTDPTGSPATPPADAAGKGPGKPDRGGPVDSKGQQLPDSVKNDAQLQALLAEAEKQKDAFIVSQKDLLSKIKGATADEKAAIKEQLKANQQKFLDDTKQLRADIADRLKELGVDLKTRGITAGGKEGGQHKRPGQ